ncbi:MAG: 3-phosphoshikimate 1-carboxyvinyltransferase [Oscillospiraceae bacterium]|nr:3-phosphoshikimate 1-carboxyvinyltransferase [Oscillospiraceae bacterium]
MNAVVYKSALAGRVSAPPSKSCAHRLLIAAALADGRTVLTGVDPTEAGEDVKATLSGLAALGASFDIEGETVRVTPIKPPNANADIDCGESGSTLRFLLPLAASLPISARFTGGGRLPDRPIAELSSQLERHGAKFDRLQPLPFTVRGGMTGGEWTLPGNVTSQYVSGLLFALPRLAETSRIALTSPLESGAYASLTIEQIAKFAVRVNEDERGCDIPGGQIYRAPLDPLAVEGDWSGAAYWIAANALGASIDIDGLSSDSVQPDRGIVEALNALRGGASEIDLSGMPDIAPILAVAAAGMQGARDTIRLTGLSRLRLKESDRVLAIACGLNALGVRAIEEADALTIPTGRTFAGGAVDGFADHRIVMAFAIAALFAEAPVTITGAEYVHKSYVRFWRDVERLGGKAIFI